MSHRIAMFEMKNLICLRFTTALIVAFSTQTIGWSYQGEPNYMQNRAPLKAKAYLECHWVRLNPVPGFGIN